jgi:hypothetical protein
MYFCLIRCKFEVWKKKTNLIFFSSMVFFSSFCSLFCFLFFVIYFLIFFVNFICFHFFSIFKCLKKILMVKVFFCLSVFVYES